MSSTVEFLSLRDVEFASQQTRSRENPRQPMPKPSVMGGEPGPARRSAPMEHQNTTAGSGDAPMKHQKVSLMISAKEDVEDHQQCWQPPHVAYLFCDSTIEVKFMTV